MLEDKSNISIELGSNKSFGVTFTIIFCIAWIWAYTFGLWLHWIFLSLAVVFFVITIFRPSLLRGLNVAWFKVGMFLARIINPLVMLLLFSILILPVGVLFRMIGRDALMRNYESNIDSYWVERKSQPKSMKNQF